MLIARLHLSLARMYFAKVVYVLLSGMLYVYKSDVSVVLFET